MRSWLDALHEQTASCILVTVATLAGSGPRDPGAKMLVTATSSFDTIGGGHLELCAMDIARTMLSLPAGTLAAERHVQRFALGASLGQCCGGMVQLVFERFDLNDAAARDHVAALHEHSIAGVDSWRAVALDSTDAPVLLNDGASTCHIFSDEQGQRWLQDPCLAQRHHLMLFGAGHVGAAIVRALADLPCRVTWVDEREEQFPGELPANVRVELTDTPTALIDAAAEGTSFLVMTHSHALDLVLAEHLLRRAQFAWFGLIGSATKRALFERRLLERGITAQQLHAMVCPIGVAGIGGKAPGVIAIAVAAQLMQVWEAQARHTF